MPVGGLSFIEKLSSNAFNEGDQAAALPEDIPQAMSVASRAL